MTKLEFIRYAGGPGEVGRKRAEYFVSRYGSEITDYTEMYNFISKIDVNESHSRRELRLSSLVEEFVDAEMQLYYESIGIKV